MQNGWVGNKTIAPGINMNPGHNNQGRRGLCRYVSSHFSHSLTEPIVMPSTK